MKKKLLILTATVFVMALIFATTVFAAEVIDGVYYNLNSTDKTATVSDLNRQNCTLETVIIPEKVVFNEVEYKVVGISNSAFENNTSIVNLVIMPKIKEYPNWFLKNCANLKALFIDLSETTGIGTMAFNIYSAWDAPVVAGKEFWFYEPSSYDAENPDNWVMIREFDLTNVTKIGGSAFHNANLDKVKIGNASIGDQTFRFAELKEVEIASENVPYYFCGHNSKLEKITIKNVKTIGPCAFTCCSSVTKVYIDSDELESVGYNAFVLDVEYDDGQSKTQWYNLEGEKKIDLSNLTTIGNCAFASSNLGSAQIAWPKALTSVSDQMFRKCHFTQPIYLNGAEGASLELKYWAFEGNSFPAVVISGGISTVSAVFTSQTNVVILSENVKITAQNVCNVGGSKIYYKSLSTDSATLNSNIELIPITNGSASNYGFCGVVATVTTANGDVTIGEVSHTISSEIDNTLCPIGKVTVTQCANCSYITYTVNGESVENKAHNFDLESGASVNGLMYVNFYEMGYRIIKCQGCEATQKEETACANPIFTFLGVSRSETPDKEGKHSIVQGFKIDTDAYDAYVEYGNTLEYGLVACAKQTVGERPLTIENGTVVAVSAEKTMLAKTNVFVHDIVQIKVKGIDEAKMSAELILCMFVSDGTNIYYMSNGTQSATAQTVTFAS